MTITPSNPPPEEVRLQALEATGLLDSDPEAAFDHLTALTSRVLRVPVSLVSLVDRNRQFFKSMVGVPEPWATRRETPLSHSFCQHVVATGEPLIVSDARENDLVRDNLAVPDLGVIAYAGMPVVDREGHLLGALCAIDGQPRDWSEEEIETLRALAAQVNTEIALRALTSDHGSQLADLRRIDRQRRRRAHLHARDLRIPLESIMLGMQALSYMGELNEAQRECIDLCLSNGRALAKLTENFCQITAIDERGEGALVWSECPPHYLVACAAERVAALFQDGSVELVRNLPDDLRSFFADEEKLVQVLVILLENAHQHALPGGQVRLSATRGRGSDAIVFHISNVGACRPDDEARIFLAGKAPGTGATKEASSHPGPGLALCQSFIEAHGGHIWLEDRPGEGTTIAFSVPA